MKKLLPDVGDKIYFFGRICDVYDYTEYGSVVLKSYSLGRPIAFPSEILTQTGYNLILKGDSNGNFDNN